MPFASSAPEPATPPPAPPEPTPFLEQVPPAPPEPEPPIADDISAFRVEPEPSQPLAAAPEPAAPASGGGEVNLNSVTFEQLRGQNLSVTQATRLLAHRERLGGFSSVDDLDQVAGFPEDVLADLKSRATV
jgi:DNA uptake protein ComE-like DNA-binding protein